ncbi:hypothetical protein JXI42_09405 [bacterium]|nr:hypothetical protein [bacterium]
MKVRLLVFGLIVVLAFSGLLFGDPPTGTSHVLIWSSLTNGGDESPEGRAGSIYKLNDVLGNGSSAATQRAEGTTYHLYGGFRKVDLDLRPPISETDDLPDETFATSFEVSWAGEDTTTEDGEGWGIWVYDVEYKVGVAGAWTAWLTGTELTHATFGPTVPEVVLGGETYYFRCRARDLATNVEDFPPDAETETYINLNIGFTIAAPDAEMDSVWKIDTIDVYTAVNMLNTDKFVITNTGAVALQMGLRADSLGNWLPGYYPALDTFVVRAIFNDNNTAPATFHAVNDVVGKTNRYASATVFGPQGLNVGSGTTENLWLYFISPTSSEDHYDEEQHIKIIVVGREFTP